MASDATRATTSKLESYDVSFRGGALARESGIHSRRPRAMDSGFATRGTPKSFAFWGPRFGGVPEMTKLCAGCVRRMVGAGRLSFGASFTIL